MADRHSDRLAIVTGGARGIGAGIAARLAGDGARIIVWDVDLAPLSAAPFEPVEALSVDVGDLAAVADAFAAAESTHGPVDILVNNAGINGPVGPAWEIAEADWTRVLKTNLSGVWHGCRAAVPAMVARGYGRIVNVASIAGKEGVPFIAGYSAAKGGVIALTKAVAREIADTGVTVNCIAPALTETPLFAQMTRDHIDAMTAKIPMGRTARIAEIADMVAWIASEECSFTTGFTFDLSGGRATY